MRCTTCAGEFKSRNYTRDQCPDCRAEGVPDHITTVNQRWVRLYNREHPESPTPVPPFVKPYKTLDEQGLTIKAVCEYIRWLEERVKALEAIKLKESEGGVRGDQPT